MIGHAAGPGALPAPPCRPRTVSDEPGRGRAARPPGRRFGTAQRGPAVQKIKIEELAFDGPELTEAELGQVNGSRYSVCWYQGGRPVEWVVS